MKVEFGNIYDHVIPLSDFRLKWRFDDPVYNELPQIHLDQLKPLDREASRFLWDFISENHLHNDLPFKRDFFRAIDETRIDEGNDSEIRKWLFHTGIAFAHDVFLSWQPDTAMIIPWKLLIK